MVCSLMDPDQLLCCLHPDDYGLKCPDSAAYFKLDKIPASDVDAVFYQLGRPYVWAQHLCGLQFLPSETYRRPVSRSTWLFGLRCCV